MILEIFCIIGLFISIFSIITDKMNVSKSENVRCVSEGTKKLVAGKQNFKCANSPKSNIVPNYCCPLWQNKNRNGSFGEEGFHIDHIKEFCISHDDNITNLQALCVSCHSVKTKRFIIPYMSNLQRKKSMKKVEEKKQEIKVEEKEENIFEIDEIIDKKKNGNKTFYLVKWKGYKYSESTWEPKENIFDNKALQKFEKLYKFYNKVK